MKDGCQLFALSQEASVPADKFWVDAISLLCTAEDIVVGGVERLGEIDVNLVHLTHLIVNEGCWRDGPFMLSLVELSSFVNAIHYAYP